MADKPQSMHHRLDAQSRPPRPSSGAPAATGDAATTSANIDLLFTQAEQALADAGAMAEPKTSAYQLQDFTSTPDELDATTLDRLRDVELDLKIELGRTEMPLADVLKLREGSVVPLDKLTADLVDIVVNGRLIGRGEVLAIDGKFCVRVVELVGGSAAPGDPASQS